MISGRENIAFLYEIQQWYSCTDLARTPAHSSQVYRTVNGTGEYKVVRETSEEQVRSLLAIEKRNADALFFVLSTLDVDVTISNRVLLAEIADDLLSDEDTSQFVLLRILSWPLPTGLIANRRSLMEVANSFPLVGKILHRVFDAQPVLQEITALWRNSAEQIGIGSDSIQTFRSELMESGFFYSILEGCLSTGADRSSRVNTTIVSELLNPSSSSSLKALLRDFQVSIKTSLLTSKPKGATSGSLFKREESSKMAVAPQAPVPLHQAVLSVQKQLSSIKNMLFADKLTLAEKYAHELMTFQLGQDDRHFAVISLCNLTASAIDANQFEFAESLINRAMELDPNDEIVFTSRAEVYKRRGYFSAALQAYEEAIVTFPYNTWALDGKADVLREMGRFDESIDLYRNIQRDFPDNSVAFNGQVSVLRSQGKQLEALQLAVSNAKRFPGDAFTRGTLAGALAANGKYVESSRQYQQAHSLDRTNYRFTVGIAYSLFSSGASQQALSFLDNCLKTSSDIHIQQARAQLLRNDGRKMEAEAAYEAILKIFPRYAPARLGLLGLKVIATPADVAQAAYEVETPESEQDWIALRSYLSALIAVGENDVAIAKITKLLPACPWLRERARLKSALGIAQMRKGDGQCIDTFQKDLYSLDASHKQVRLLLLSRAHLKQRRPKIAQVLLTSVIATKDPFLLGMKQSLLALSRNVATVQQQSDISQREIMFALAA